MLIDTRLANLKKRRDPEGIEAGRFDARRKSQERKTWSQKLTKGTEMSSQLNAKSRLSAASIQSDMQFGLQRLASITSEIGTRYNVAKDEVTLNPAIKATLLNLLSQLAETAEGMHDRIRDTRVTASLEDPTSGGVQTNMLIDGGPNGDEEPMVQKLTKDDGGVETAPEQDLLMDDLSV